MFTIHNQVEQIEDRSGFNRLEHIHANGMDLSEFQTVTLIKLRSLSEFTRKKVSLVMNCSPKWCQWEAAYHTFIQIQH